MDELLYENNGPVERISIPRPEGGGVILFRGENGAGKTKLLEATKELLHKGSGSVTCSDHAKRGEVSGLGVTIRFGRSTRRTGELEVESIEGRLSIADLVDPGLKSEEASDAARIRALACLQDAQVERADWIKLAPPGEETPLAGETLTGDIVAQAGQVRRIYHAHAKAIEKDASFKKAKAASVLDELADVESLELPDVDKLADAYAEQSAKAQRIESGRDTYQTGKSRLADSSMRLVTLKECSRDPDAASLKADECRANINIAEAIVQGLEDDLTEARQDLLARKSEFSIAEEKRDSAKRAASEIAALAIDVAELKAIPTVTDDDVTEANAATNEAKRLHDSGVVVREKLLRRITAAKNIEEANVLIKTALAWRDAAKATDDVLAGAIKTGPLKIVGGRVMAKHKDRGLAPYSEMSHGERYTIAIDIAADNLGEGGYLVADQTAWEGLDPDNKRHVISECKRRGIFLFTAEATAGELRAEVAE
jgi:hypothetical protein